MDVYQILGLIGIPTLASLIVADLWAKIKASTKKAKELHDKECKDLMKAAIREEIDPMKTQVGELQSDLGLMKKGTQASLRNSLYKLYDECSKKGYATYDDRNNFENLYDNYHKLGANGVMDDIRKKFLDLKIDNDK